MNWLQSPSSFQYPLLFMSHTFTTIHEREKGELKTGTEWPDKTCGDLDIPANRTLEPPVDEVQRSARHGAWDQSGCRNVHDGAHCWLRITRDEHVCTCMLCTMRQSFGHTSTRKDRTMSAIITSWWQRLLDDRHSLCFEQLTAMTTTSMLMIRFCRVL